MDGLFLESVVVNLCRCNSVESGTPETPAGVSYINLRRHFIFPKIKTWHDFFLQEKVNAAREMNK